jgi:hypothetical protein
MIRNGIFSALVISAITIITITMLPDEQTSSNDYSPWDIAISTDGKSHVFGVTIDDSSLKEAQQNWNEYPKVTLFITEGSPSKVEAYFQQVLLGGIKASIVAGINLSDKTLSSLINNGVRISTQGDGARKVTLDEGGIETVENSSISSITYLPKSKVSPEIIRKRFGEPSEIISIEEDLEHWIYSAIGLDVVVSSAGNNVFQYISPINIDRLTDPLRAKVTNLGD